LRSISAFHQEAYHCQTAFVDEGGEETSVEVTLSSILWEDSQAKALVLRDISERARNEEEARERLQRLMLTDKLTSLGVLMAAVAHEINNPNQVIMSNISLLCRAGAQMVSLLKASSSDAEGFQVAGLTFEEFLDAYPEMMGGIEDGSARIDAIIKNLRSFSREEEAAMSPLNVNTVVKQALGLLAPYIRRATNRFRFQSEEALPMVKGNAQRLGQVIVNLVLNACQALPSADRGIEVTTRHDAGKHRVLIVVKDEGEGIAASDLERIKEPFYTTKREIGGTGLGLHVSDKIVREHDAVLSFTSAPGRGTEAMIALPEAPT
jgi:polar amino acid transport system substrate-binding protein